MGHKRSIRFYNDRLVRAVWDELQSKWWFSAIDIVRAINDDSDYVKAGNYWRWLKKKLIGEGVQLVSMTHDFKFEAPDGKQRASDALDAQCVQTIAKHYPNNRANAFLDWFTYSDNTLDGQSKKKAYDLFEGNGRTTRIWLDLMLKRSLRQCIDWSLVDKNDYLDSMRKSVTDAAPIKSLLRGALTDKINDRETFMKGIDYSYYYEEGE